ncbi:MAG TPA: S8 family serine peptidase [Candidatus Tidjanibacter gallistercoris]|nr:S8 family serine peptidase [Candidatus Tidjanibacter gallistercoris]
MENGKWILTAAAAAFAIAACTRDPLSEPFAAPADAETGQNGGEEDYVAGWVRVRLAENALPLHVGKFTRGEAASGNRALDEVAARFGATEIRRVFAEGGRFAERRRRFGLHLWYDIRIDENASVTRAGGELASVPGIDHVQPIWRIRWADNPVAMPAEYLYEPFRPKYSEGAAPVNDPEVDKQWHYHNDGSRIAWKTGADINLFEAWRKFNAGRPDVIVAVMDTGVQWDHPDLAANMWVNEAELYGSKGVDDDGNGYVDDVYGYDFGNCTGTIVGEDHGTHIAGTIAAVNNNGTGVCGIAGGTGNGDGVRIMSVQFYSGVQESRYVDAFVYAADNGAVIASNSWVVSMDVMPADVSAALDYFIANAGMDDTDGDGVNDVQRGPMKGGVCIFGSGNDHDSGVQYKGRIFYPAADERVIAVTAMGPDYKRAYYSQYGQGADIMAPGGDDSDGSGCAVYSTLTESGYGYLSGTSMATPHVSGVAALIVSQYGGAGFTAEELRRILLSSYRNVGDYQDEDCRNLLGVGLVDASLIDNYYRNPGTPPAAPQQAGVEGVADGLVFSCKVPEDANGDAAAWLLLRYAPVGEAEAVPTELRLACNAEAGTDFSYSATAPANTEFDVSITAEDRYGNLSQPWSDRVKSLPHVNRPPVITAAINDFIIQKTGVEHVRRYDLSAYCYDADIAEYGDELRYEVVKTGAEGIVEISLDGAEATLEPVGIGTTEVVVRISDLEGEYADAAFAVSVIHRPVPDVTIERAGRGHVLSLPLAEYFHVIKGAEYKYVAKSSDLSVVKVSISKGKLNIVPVARGRAAVTLSCKPGRYDTVGSEFTVVVSEDADASGGALSIYPNPVNGELRIRLSGASGAAAVRVYDASARTVIDADAVLDDNGTWNRDVSVLSPGTYSVVVIYEGRKYSGTFVKR